VAVPPAMMHRHLAKAGQAAKIDKYGDIDSMQNNYENINILTVQEVAKLLRLHRSTVSRYATSGELKSYLIGNRRLFKEADVLTFFENKVDREYVFGEEL
jgi:excisionase family DNA binding protein